MLATDRPAASRPCLSPAEALGRVLAGAPLRAEWFAPSLLRATPLRHLEETLARIVRAHGPCVGVEAHGGTLEARFTHATVPVTVVLAEDRILTLLFDPPRTSSLTPEAVLDRLKALPGRLGVLLLSDGADVVAHESETPLAVASGFKLAVLLAVRRAVDEGAARWDDVVRLTEESRSLPPGPLHEWPAGSPLTLQSLATLMMSQSDNTATDLLIHTLGRGRVEAIVPALSPLLTTREHCLLKLPAHAGLRERFARGDRAERRAVLAALAGVQAPTPEALPTLPTDHEVGWHLSPRALCDLMAAVADLDLATVRPAPLNADGWDRVAVKTGSEPGVLSLTAWLEHGGRRSCLSVTLNARQPIDVPWVHLLFQQLAGTLRASGWLHSPAANGVAVRC